MIERLNAMTPRAKLIALVVVIALGLIGVWLGYNLGHWMATH